MLVGADTTDPIQDVIACGILVLGILTYVGNRQAKSNGSKLDDQADRLTDVHDLVNSQLSDAVDRKDVAEARTKVLEDNAKEADG